ncbi:MAG: hypothetical protein GC150_11035 [Rhizobiales bacterium]|nr:hypothetical protein [Hyphomicrobiales bacterium]
MNTDSPSMWSALAVAGALVALLLAAIVVVHWFAGSQIVLSAISLATAIIVASIQYKSAKDKETDARLFTQKQAVYTELMDTIMRLFHDRKVELSEGEQAELARKFQTIRTKLIIWGSYDTIRHLDQMGTIADDLEDGDPTKGLLWLGNTFAAMRKDLGHRDPTNAGAELALGMLKPSDREKARAKILAT